MCLKAQAGAAAVALVHCETICAVSQQLFIQTSSQRSPEEPFHFCSVGDKRAFYGKLWPRCAGHQMRYCYFISERELRRTILCDGAAHPSVICCGAPSRVIHDPSGNLQATGHFVYLTSDFSVCTGECLCCSLPPPLPFFSLSQPASKPDLADVLPGKRKASRGSHCFTDTSLLSWYRLDHFILMNILIFPLLIIVCLSA